MQFLRFFWNIRNCIYLCPYFLYKFRSCLCYFQKHQELYLFMSLFFIPNLCSFLSFFWNIRDCIYLCPYFLYLLLVFLCFFNDFFLLVFLCFFNDFFLLVFLRFLPPNLPGLRRKIVALVGDC